MFSPHFLKRITQAIFGRMSAVETTKASTSTQGRLVWIDCEMTGLEPEQQTLVEIAAIVTDSDLNIVAEGPDIVIHQNEQVLDNMNPWCKKTFAKNGLLQKIRDSKVTMEEAESQVMTFLEPLVEKGVSPIAGNTVWMDRVFIKKYMPRLDGYLHYRTVDVSTIKELSLRWFPNELKKAPRKKGLHRALDDIKESIEELKFYKTAVFKQK